MSHWRRWVLVFLGVQSVLLALVVVALWPLLKARMPDIRPEILAQSRPKKTYVTRTAQGDPPRYSLQIYVAPTLQGEVACTFFEPHTVVSQAPLPWRWQAVRTWLRHRDVMEIITNPRDPGTPSKACRGFVARKNVVDLSP